MFISFVVVGFIVELYGLQDFFTFLLANHVKNLVSLSNNIYTPGIYDKE